MTARPDWPPPSRPDSWYEPPAENWGRCPNCGASQEDARHYRDTDLYQCPECGREYTEEEAREEP